MATRKSGRKAKTPAQFIRDQYLSGKPTAQVLRNAQKRFPGAPIDSKYVCWYQWKLRKSGALKTAS